MEWIVKAMKLIQVFSGTKLLKHFALEYGRKCTGEKLRPLVVIVIWF